MRKKAWIRLGCIILVLALGLPAQQAEKTLSLSLEECIVKALKNNLGVAISVLDPQLADIQVTQATEKFMPQFSMSFDSNRNNQASYSWLDAEDQTITKSLSYQANITQQIPTGGNFSIRVSGNRTDTNRNFQTINPRYNTILRFDFSQPLLRNFGPKISRREIIVARNRREVSENNLIRSLQDTVYNVEQAYWNLVSAIETLKVRQQSLQLARDFLERQRRAVEVGTEAPIEILSAQSEVAGREADILDAEAQVRNYEDDLKFVLNLAAELEEVDSIRIIPTDKPEFKEKEINLEEALMTALAKRPDLEASRIDLRNREIDVTYARNQLLPDLSLNASYWSPGVSGSRVIYLNNNPLTGVIVDTVPGGAGDALRDTFGFKFKNWTVGLTLSIPFQNIFSKASLAQAKVNLEQAMLSLKQQEEQIFLEIKKAVRAVQTNFKRVQAYRVARELQEKTLQAEEEKFKVGLTTPYLILQYQRDLANAQNQELRAIIDYNLSLANLSRVLGTSLEEKNISITDIRNE